MSKLCSYNDFVGKINLSYILQCKTQFICNTLDNTHLFVFYCVWIKWLLRCFLGGLIWATFCKSVYTGNKIDLKNIFNQKLLVNVTNNDKDMAINTGLRNFEVETMK